MPPTGVHPLPRHRKLALWGLRLGPRLVVNLRSETAGRRRDLQRCVIPADGFYEWIGEKGHKRPL